MDEPAPAGVARVFMLAWFLVPLCLVLAMQPPAAPRADTKVALPLEGLLRQIADHFNITDVSEGLEASRSFHDAVHHAVKSFYSYEYDGVAYPDYTKMAYSLGELLTGKAYTTYRFKLVTANLSLPSYMC